MGRGGGGGGEVIAATDAIERGQVNCGSMAGSQLTL